MKRGRDKENMRFISAGAGTSTFASYSGWSFKSIITREEREWVEGRVGIVQLDVVLSGHVRFSVVIDG